ncbi:MAG: aconitate hydratase AcnA [Thiolinea sp.]
MTTSLKDTCEILTGSQAVKMVSFKKVAEQYDLSRLPYAAKILLENLLRHADQNFVSEEDIIRIAEWNVDEAPTQEIAFVPARVILQDFTGVPAIVDLAAMRDAIAKLGGSPEQINPLSPCELVIDHSVMVDYFAIAGALQKNTRIEVQRNRERYQFLKWGQQAFQNLHVVPPGRGIVHQVNLEYLARCVFDTEIDGERWAYPDTLVGTDSHTTMINGLGILGWGVGGIEAEAAMLGQPVTMLIPKVVGFRLDGQLQPGVTATDLVLTITERLREHGVVGKFVEFYGSGLQHLSTADRATIANMAPEYGATCGIFPLDAESLRYLELTGRDAEHIDLVEQYARTLGIWHDADHPPASYHEHIEFDLASVRPSVAGPKRPQDRLLLEDVAGQFKQWMNTQKAAQRDQETSAATEVEYRDAKFTLQQGAVVIAAITSCTNTSNPSVMIAAGLVAKKAREKGLSCQPWVKTSFAPGSQVVSAYLQNAGLMDDLDALGFHLVGYGCTTCIGNSGPLPEPVSEAVRRDKLAVCSVLSGNRNFEGRIHAEVAANYLASPPLVVAYAIAGNINVDLTRDALGTGSDGQPVYLRDIWPDDAEIRRLAETFVAQNLFREKYADVFEGDEDWQALSAAADVVYDWPESSYIKHPPFFEGMRKDVPEAEAVTAARCLVKVGDSVTTDHISPAGAIAEDSPAGQYLKSLGISPANFNSYGSRRGNHEVMMRGTFANVRLRNQLAPGTEGSWTTYFPTGERMSIFDAAMKYREDQTPVVILAGKEYGTGSSRDWAAKGPDLLGVKAVLAESYERIHRSNLIGMGILPLQFKAGENADSHDLSGDELFSVPVIKAGDRRVEVTVAESAGATKQIEMLIRIDTDIEFEYYANGGILQYVLRQRIGR